MSVFHMFLCVCVFVCYFNCVGVCVCPLRLRLYVCLSLRSPFSCYYLLRYVTMSIASTALREFVCYFVFVIEVGILLLSSLLGHKMYLQVFLQCHIWFLMSSFPSQQGNIAFTSIQ